jgi:hypothetical protein
MCTLGRCTLGYCVSFGTSPRRTRPVLAAMFLRAHSSEHLICLFAFCADLLCMFLSQQSLVPQALMLSHPFHMTRDTAKYRPLQRAKGMPRSLKWLAKNILNVKIQSGEHSPVRIPRRVIIWRVWVYSSTLFLFLLWCVYVCVFVVDVDDVVVLFCFFHLQDQDARASLFIWRTIRKDWEARIKHTISKSKGTGSQRETAAHRK